VSRLVRAFVAVEVSEGARQAIAGLLERLSRAPGAPVRWVKPELMHLTLAFLGEVPPDFIDAARARLAEVVPGHRAFTMQLRGLGAFPSPGRARVVWLGAEQGRDEVGALQADAVEALRSIGFEPERRPFSPHLTIGRLKFAADVGGVVSVPFESEAFRVGRVVLFRSVLGPAGPTYTSLGEFLLRAG
jgi:2'-5' RNA ligase